MKISSIKEDKNISCNDYFTFSNSHTLFNHKHLTNQFNLHKIETKFFPYESRISSINNGFYKDLLLPK